MKNKSKQLNMWQRLFGVLTTIALIVGAFPIITLAETAPVEIFVSPSGNDATGDGSLEKPFLTLAAAQSKVRSLKSANQCPNGVNVNLRGGTYYLTEKFTLTAEDSGTAEAPIVWQNYNNEKVEITGGINVKGSSFDKVTDTAVLNRIIDKNARDFIYSYNLNELGKDLGIANEPYLRAHHSYQSEVLYLGYAQRPSYYDVEPFFNGTPMTLSRYPNNEMMKIKSVIEEGDKSKDGTDENFKGKGFTITIDSNRMKHWTNAPQGSILMTGFWYWDWADQTIPLLKADIYNNRLTSEWFSIYGVRKDHGFFVENLIEELDAPGEYYIDRENSVLYIYPPSDIKTANVTLSYLKDTYLISLDNTSYVTLKGLNVSVSRSGGISLGGSNNLVTECEIYNMAGYGISMGGSKNVVSDCHIFDVNGGVYVLGGDVYNLTPAENKVLNCHIERFSRIKLTYTPAIYLAGVGNMAAFNEIHDAPHNAIMVLQNNHKVYFNEIYDVLKETDDAAAIYGGMTWATRGHDIKYNYIHDISSTSKGASGVWGVYLDGGMCGVNVEGNIFENLKAGGVFINGGRDNTVKNNYAVNCGTMLQIYTALSPSSISSTYRPALNSYLNSDAWKREYPSLFEMLELTNEEICEPRNNTYVDNICYNSGVSKGNATEYLKENHADDNYVSEANPGFVSLGSDTEKKDFSLVENAPVYAELSEDFSAIPFKCIGRNGSMACLTGECTH